jgi:hypothetical protein
LQHAALLASSANPHRTGEAEGQLDAISVDFVEPEVMAGDAAGPKGDTHAEEQSQGQTHHQRPEVPRPATKAVAGGDSTREARGKGVRQAC